MTKMTKIIVANWKSNKSVAGATEWFDSLASALGSPQRVELVLAVPFVFLGLALERVGKLQANPTSNISLGVQDLSPYPAGSYTGAVSGYNLEGLGVKYAVLGHSERRRYFHETNQDVAAKVEQALASGITPIVCVDQDYIASQASVIDENMLARCVVAFEPISAIGNGNNADLATVKTAIESIRQNFGQVPVLYGGSVDEQNINEYLIVCDGVIVGTASLDALQLARVVEKSGTLESL
jgi:triosephosphate isomerase (TIM)